MRKLGYSSLFLLPVLAIGQTTFQIDSAHSSAAFSVKHMMVSNVRGEFGKMSGTVVWDASNLSASKVEATIDATSINTRETKRDDHLKSPDFFDTAQFPTITFVSKEITKGGSGLQLKGDLTMHGITREVVLNVDGPTPAVKDPGGNTRWGATATTKINRKDFGLTWNRAMDAGGVVVGEEVTITIDIEAIHRVPGAKKKS